ncbi:hypothetical protein DL768_009767 [Monosporascus sp. mg162]|nr:hypothetical protein DL768_009767 [Monosporascus sp. mg162]
MQADIKVIFKGSDPTNPDTGDLEAEILARDPSTASYTHWLASSVIRRLRSPIRSISNLFATLRPRSTFEIIQQLIKHLWFVSHTTFLYGHPTITDSGGFSWCPATLDNIPIKVEETD